MATVTKRGKYWRAQIRRLGFPPQHKSFDTRAEAEAWARAAESEMDRGIFGALQVGQVVGHSLATKL